MVLWKATILGRVRPAPRTGAQIGNQFFQLGGASFYFYPDQKFSPAGPNEQIESIGGGTIPGAARFQSEMVFRPAALENEPAGGGELAKIFAEQARRFPRKNPVSAALLARAQELARDFAGGIDLEETFVPAPKKIFGFPLGQRGADSKHRKSRLLPGCFAHRAKSFLKPGFEF